MSHFRYSWRTHAERWTQVFSRSTLGPQVYYVRCFENSLSLANWGSELPADLLWSKILQACKRLELPCSEERRDSMLGGCAMKRDYVFLDGGLFSREGLYFFGRKGAWVAGRKALRLLCYELGVPQPRRWPGEREIPTREALLAEAFKQLEENEAALDKSLAVFSEL
jgi:hypothetical protein